MAQNHEPFIAVWLDSGNAIPYDESFHRKAQLSSMINFNIKFSDFDECLEYIKTIQTENIFLIISGSLGENIVPIIYHLPQLLYIYVYCSNKVKHEEWANNENYIAKIRGVFVDIDLLLAKINDDVKLELKNMLPSTIFHKYDDFKLKEMTVKDLNSQSAQFMWFQLLINTLLHGNYTNNAKDEMFHECVQQYNGNEIELKKIVDFYLGQSKSSVGDLYDQLTDISLVQNENSSSIKVYRGQLMQYDELQNLKENIGQLISINTFFSTTLLSSVAIDFAGNGSGRPHYESVFFEINVDSTSVTKPFANIQNHSFMKDENEILFCVGTVFRIVSVEEYDDVWHVTLQTSNDENIELKELLEHFSKNVVEEKPTLIALADLLQDMGEFDKAQRFAQLFIDELEPVDQQHHSNTIQSTIGLLDYYKGDFHKALKNCETALIMQLQQDTSELIPDDLKAVQHSLGLIYNNVAVIYQHIQKYKEAMNFLKNALNLIDNDHIHIGTVWCNIAIVYCKICEYQSALDYCAKSLTLQSRKLPSNHPTLAGTHIIAGLIHHQMGNYDDALKSYEKAAEIHRNILTIDHPFEAMVQANRGMIYIDKGDFQTAIDISNKALIVFSKFENHPTLAIMYNNLGLAYLRCNNYSMAQENFEKALQIQLVSLPGDHLSIATSYNNLATVYFEEDNYDIALENYNKALEMQIQCLSSKFNPDIALTYNNIGSIYFRLEKYSLALENFEQALTIMKKCLPVDHFDFALIYNNIGLIYSINEEYIKALDNYNKALNIETVQDHPFVARTYLNIGDVHRITANYDLALEAYKKSLDIQFKCSTQNNQDLLRTYNVMTVVSGAMNDKAMSLEYYKKFLTYLLIERPLDFDEHLTAYKNIADLLFLTDNLIASREYYEKAMETAQKISSLCPEDMIDLLKRPIPVTHSVEEDNNTNH